MTALAVQSVGIILANIADCIEGGVAHVSADRLASESTTNYDGIAGTRSIHQYAETEVTETTGGSQSFINQTDILDADAHLDRGTKQLITGTTHGPPPLFAVCNSATDSDNLYAARRISTYLASTGKITTLTTLPANNDIGDTYLIREGFRRVPDNYSIADDDVPNGFDRFYDLRLTPGSRLPWYGNGTETYQGELTIRLRIVKHARHVNAEMSALENMMMIISTVTRDTKRGENYIQLINGEEADISIEAEDSKKIISVATMPLTYRVSANIL